jgi:general secretion pathway protein E
MPDASATETAYDALAAQLLADRVVDADALGRAIAVARQERGRLDRILLRLGLVEEADLLPPLCRLHGLAMAVDHGLEPDVQLAGRLGQPFLASRRVVPLMGPGAFVPVATADPLDQATMDELAFHLERPVVPVGATTATIRKLLTRLDDPQSLAEDSKSRQIERDVETLRRSDTDGPVIRFVQEKLTDAVLQGASDFHLEASGDGYSLRYRINGVLVPQRVDRTLDPATVVARLKVMAGVNVAERRLPQDGRLETVIAGRKIDFRFSSLPTHDGESIVARVLDPKALRLGWEKLGFDAEIVARVKAILERPNGLFLVTGPTGSGKTTTLYTAISHLNSPRRKIVTVEDPVEYNIAGVQQIQVHEEIGLSFARVLRGVLRHDPNVILVGEIRDPETAEIAVRAAQVGRLVLSTLHTNSAEGAMTRLVDLGVPEYLLRDVLRGVLGQELMLTPCPACAGRGCDTCEGTGVAGRKLRAELLEM